MQGWYWALQEVGPCQSLGEDKTILLTYVPILHHPLQWETRDLSCILLISLTDYGSQLTHCLVTGLQSIAEKATLFIVFLKNRIEGYTYMSYSIWTLGKNWVCNRYIKVLWNGLYRHQTGSNRPTGRVFSTGQIKVGFGYLRDCPAKN